MIWPWKKRDIPLGQQGEDLACRFLRKQGFKILDRNVRIARCEIDIIAKEGNTIVFVEVKTRRQAGVFRPEDSVGAEKEDHVRMAGGFYLQRQRMPDADCRFDIVSIVLPETGDPEIKLIRNAF